MNKVLALLVLCGVAFVAACSLGPQPINGADRDAVLAYAEPKSENLLTGYNSGDYAVFARDFDSAMRTAESEPVFVQTRTQLMSKLGHYLERTVSDVVKQDQFVVVLYNAKFELADNVTVRVVLHPDGERQITGLWFNAPALQ